MNKLAVFYYFTLLCKFNFKIVRKLFIRCLILFFSVEYIVFLKFIAGTNIIHF